MQSQFAMPVALLALASTCALGCASRISPTPGAGRVEVPRPAPAVGAPAPAPAVAGGPAPPPQVASASATGDERAWQEVGALLPKQVGEWRQREVGFVTPAPTVTSTYSEIEGGEAVIVNINVGAVAASGDTFVANTKIDGFAAQVNDYADVLVVVYAPHIRIEVNSTAVEVMSFATALGIRRIGKGVEAALARSAPEALERLR
jgi:hypothetical protein